MVFMEQVIHYTAFISPNLFGMQWMVTYLFLRFLSFFSQIQLSTTHFCHSARCSHVLADKAGHVINHPYLSDFLKTDTITFNIYSVMRLFDS